MLRRLCFKPSTYKTFSIVTCGGLPILPIPKILPLLLSPYVTNPSFGRIKLNFDLSPVICLEQPLSRYHRSFSALKHTYKINLYFRFRYPK
ncbi:hypothetical protein Lalb_Chr18g0050161 [Lupinus albus]|uniref:Uncharacterized protein n=1 Tax=Lupinus albus TaxID=3870 RepID=A0A6A4P639_LUPAL|nr:hypothetical protein Lalb_Chr18g0050161 [Lupinus albus]